jgi:hypothetical protein
MRYSIFDGSGNLVDAFGDWGPAIDRLGRMAQESPEAAARAFLVLQNAEGNLIGDTIFANAVLASE